METRRSKRKVVNSVADSSAASNLQGVKKRTRQSVRLTRFPLEASEKAEGKLDSRSSRAAVKQTSSALNPTERAPVPVVEAPSQPSQAAGPSSLVPPRTRVGQFSSNEDKISNAIKAPADPAAERMDTGSRQRRGTSSHDAGAGSGGQSDKDPIPERFGRECSGSSSALHGILKKLGAGFDEILLTGSCGSRLKGIIAGLKQLDNEGQHITALTELCEVLSISTEESLSSFPVEQVVPSLVQSLNSDVNPDATLLAARALTFLADVLPSSCASIVRHGAVPAFCARLLTVEYIDLAEQSLQALEKLSHEHPQHLLRNGGLVAVLSYLDFFPTGVQRVAVATAANMCHGVSAEHSQAITEAVPMLTALLEYQDAKVVDGACLALTYIARAFSNKPALLEVLTTNGLINRATQLINVSGTGSMTSQLSVTTFFGLIKLLATCAAGSQQVAQHLLQAGISEVLKTLLSTSSVLACGPAPAAVLRSPDQLYEVVCLAHELLPAIPDSRTVVQQDLPALAPSPGESAVLCKFLEENPGVLATLTADLLPLLLQVFGSSVLPQVRHQVLSTIVKLLYFGTPSILEESLKDLPIASFICNLLNAQNSMAAAFALHMAELLMEKVPGTYRAPFLKEGVLHAIDQVSAPASKGIDIPRRQGVQTRSRKAAAEQAAATTVATPEPAPQEDKPKTTTAPESSAVALRTAIAQRALKFKTKYFGKSGGPADSLDTDGMRTLRRLCGKLHKDPSALKQLCEFVTNPGSNVSVFEMLGSGMVKQLHGFLTGVDLPPQGPNRDDTILQRMSTFIDVAMPRESSPQRPALLELVRKMQQALASAENFPVVCSSVSSIPSFGSSPGSSNYFMGLGLSPGSSSGSGGRPPMPMGGGNGSFSSSSSLSSSLSSGLAALAHPFKLRLMRHAKESKLKEYPPNIVLIEPLASLAALEEFLLPKVIGPGAPMSSGSKPSSPMPTGANGPFGGASKSNSINIPPAPSSTPASNMSSPSQLAGGKGRKSASVEDRGTMRLTRSAAAAAGSASQAVTAAVESAAAAAVAAAAAAAAPPPRRGTRSAMSHPLAVGPSSRAGTSRPASNGNIDDAGSAEAMSEDDDGELMVLRHMSTVSAQDVAGDVDMDDDGREEGMFEDEDDQEMHMEDARHEDDEEEEEEEDDDDDDDDDDNDDGDDDDGRHVSADDLHAPTLRVHDLHVARCPSRPSARSMLQHSLLEEPPAPNPTHPPWRTSNHSSMSHAAVVSKSAGKLSFYLKGTRLASNMTVFQAIQQSHFTSQMAQAEDPDSAAGAACGRRLWEEVYTFHYCLASTDVEPSQVPPSTSSTPSSTTPLSPTEDFSPLRELLSLNLPSDLQATPACLEVLRLLQLLEALNRLSPWLSAYSDTLAHSMAQQERIQSNNSSSSSKGGDDLCGVGQGDLGRVPVGQSEFVSAKLGSKLAQQLKDVLSICGGGMPPWCRKLVFSCRMLFPFEVRRQYFYCTAFGLGRALQYIQQLHSTEGGGPLPNDRDARELRIGRLHRQKVRVSRKRILESAMKVMEMYARQKAVLELEYFGEVGTGLGPTLEFYTLLSHELQRHSLGLWRTQDPPRMGSVAGVHTPGDEATANAADSNAVLYVNAPHGLFPAPWHDSQSAQKTKVLECFRLLGRTVGKALQDSRLVDLPLSEVFYKLVLGRAVDVYDICSFDPGLGATLLKLRAALNAWTSAGCEEPLLVDGVPIEDLCLSFTLPGHPDYVLKPGGSDMTITSSNLGEYLQAVVAATLNDGISDQINVFREGLNEVVKLESLSCFFEHEIDTLLCGAGERWAVPMLSDSIKFDHGYNANSPAVTYFLEILAELDPHDQRRFLRFVTGCPRLPAGGVAALHPRLTVVRKAPSGDNGVTPATTPTAQSLKDSCSTAADCDLPSVMTCANYIKLPPYSSKEVMLERLLYAIREGQGSFDLS